MISDLSLSETTLKTEKWYGTKYKVSNIKTETLSKWTSPKLGTHNLHMPLENKFIPTNLSLVMPSGGDNGKCCMHQKLWIIFFGLYTKEFIILLHDRIGESQSNDERNYIPQLISDTTDDVKIWHLLDWKFKKPKMVFAVQLTNPVINASPTSESNNIKNLSKVLIYLFVLQTISNFSIFY